MNNTARAAYRLALLAASMIVIEPSNARLDHGASLTLRYLAGYFDTIEINSTFYRPASAAVARGWTERVAGHGRFRFAAKLWRRFTHERDTAWTAEEMDSVRAGFDPLVPGVVRCDISGINVFVEVRKGES